MFASSSCFIEAVSLYLLFLIHGDMFGHKVYLLCDNIFLLKEKVKREI